MTLQSAALLFPAISLLMLSYTNKFLALAALIRSLYASYIKDHDPKIKEQIKNLRERLHLICDMQYWGVVALRLCLISMVCTLIDLPNTATWTFFGGLLTMGYSLSLLSKELKVSLGALDLAIQKMEVL